MLKDRLPARLTPLAARFGLRPFYGDLHNHCALSYGHGSLETALARAKRQLDFVSVTGHAYWPDMPVDDPSVRHIVAFHEEGFARLEAGWDDHFRTLREAAHETFTVFPGYEIHSCAHGDLTILYRSLDRAPIVKADSPAALLEALGRRVPGDALAFHHHLAYRVGARGINWASFEPRLTPVAEIVSMHGLSEDSLGDRPFLHSMGPGDGASTVVHGLGEGHVFGFLGNTDHHSGYPGSYGHGRSALYARQNTPDALWETLWQRRTTALTGDCAHLFTALGDAPQGSIVPPGAAGALAIEAVGGSVIDMIDVIRNGRLAARISPELSPAPLEHAAADGSFETLLVLELGWGSRGSFHDWTGTLSIASGDILAVEPRLRGAEIVSPLEGEDEAAAPEWIEADAGTGRIRFALRARANPNNRTPAMQAIAARVRVAPSSIVEAELCGTALSIPVARLMNGALSGNLGPIDSPAYRFHPMPLPEAWQWHGHVPVEPLAQGDTLYVRMRQKNGQSAWASAFFCR